MANVGKFSYQSNYKLKVNFGKVDQEKFIICMWIVVLLDKCQPNFMGFKCISIILSVVWTIFD